MFCALLLAPRAQRCDSFVSARLRLEGISECLYSRFNCTTPDTLGDGALRDVVVRPNQSTAGSSGQSSTCLMSFSYTLRLRP
jgi:hypothetical protein